MGDIRLDSNLSDHPKTRKTIRDAGESTMLGVIFLWAWASKFRPDGDLSGLTPDEICDAAKVRSRRKVFVPTLLELGWLDKNEAGELQIHDYIDRQPWIQGAKERQANARKAANSRFSKESEMRSASDTECAPQMRNSKVVNARYSPSPLVTQPLTPAPRIPSASEPTADKPPTPGKLGPIRDAYPALFPGRDIVGAHLADVVDMLDSDKLPAARVAESIRAIAHALKHGEPIKNPWAAVRTAARDTPPGQPIRWGNAPPMKAAPIPAAPVSPDLKCDREGCPRAFTSTVHFEGTDKPPMKLCAQHDREFERSLDAPATQIRKPAGDPA